MCGIDDSLPDNYYCAVRKDLIDLVPPGFRSVLEIGCGEGDNAAYLRRGNLYCWNDYPAVMEKSQQPEWMKSLLDQ